MLKSILKFLRERWWILLFAGIILILLVRFRQPKKESYALVKPKSGEIEEVVEVSGRVSVGKNATLRFLGGGKLTFLGVKEGDAVVKGQKIAAIDARDLQKSLKASLNSYVMGRNNLEQSRFDNKDVPLTDSVFRTLQKQQLTMDNNIIDVELKDLAYKNATLVSPLDGVIVSVPTNQVGMQVSATDVFEIADPATLQFVGEVDEVDIGKVQVGQNCRIVLDSYPTENIQAYVNEIALRASVSSKSSGGTVFLVRVNLPRQNIFHSRLGMNGTLKIITKKAKQALLIPQSALLVHDGKNFVNVKKPNGKLQEVEVKLGVESDEMVQIVSGIADSDDVVMPK